MDDRIMYDPDSAEIRFVDDYRPYAVMVNGRTYRFPDKWAAEDFLRAIDEKRSS